MSDENVKRIKFPCITVTQPIGQFYIAAIPCRDLAEISYADRRRIEQGDREIEVVSGLQRPLSPKRVAEIKKYVTNVDACFPTGVILAIGSEDADFDPDTNMMSVKYATNVAKIIDGQHRIEGLAGYQGSDSFDINVTIFIEMEMEDQAIVFSTINLKQTPVSNSLVYDLFEYAQTRSPQKSCHYIARLLNSREGSPFKNRIMILGTATGKPNETLTQAAFIDPLIRLITLNSTTAMEDRDLLKRGKSIPLAEPGAVRTKKLVFRNMFIKEFDARIAKVIWNYFSAVSKKWPDAWNVKTPGLILNRTTGYRALMQFLPLVILSKGMLDRVPEESEFDKVFEKVNVTDLDFNTDAFKPGSSGQSALRRLLEQRTGISESTAWSKEALTKSK